MKHLFRNHFALPPYFQLRLFSLCHILITLPHVYNAGCPGGCSGIPLRSTVLAVFKLQSMQKKWTWSSLLLFKVKIVLHEEPTVYNFVNLYLHRFWEPWNVRGVLVSVFIILPLQRWQGTLVSQFLSEPTMMPAAYLTRFFSGFSCLETTQVICTTAFF